MQKLDELKQCFIHPLKKIEDDDAELVIFGFWVAE